LNNVPKSTVASGMIPGGPPGRSKGTGLQQYKTAKFGGAVSAGYAAGGEGVLLHPAEDVDGQA